MRGFSIVRWRTNQQVQLVYLVYSHLADVPLSFLRGLKQKYVTGAVRSSTRGPSKWWARDNGCRFDCIQQISHECRALSLCQSDDCDLDLLMIFDFPNGKSLGIMCFIAFRGFVKQNSRRCTCSWPLFCHSCSTLSHLRCTQAWIKPEKTGERILGTWPLGYYPEGAIQKGGMGQYLCELHAQTPHFV